MASNPLRGAKGVLVHSHPPCSKSRTLHTRLGVSECPSAAERLWGLNHGRCRTCVVSDIHRAGQGRAGQGRAGQGRAGQGRAGQGRDLLPVLHTSHKNTFWINDISIIDGVS